MTQTNLFEVAATETHRKGFILNEGPVQYNNVIPEFTIGLNMKAKTNQLCTATSSADCAAIFRRCFNPDQLTWRESFYVLALNRSNRVLGFMEISAGGISGTVADPRIILQFAILSNAAYLILAHNHPSGSLTPSQADQALTQKIKTAALYFDIKIFDHIIITDTSYYSFADEGIL